MYRITICIVFNINWDCYRIVLKNCSKKRGEWNWKLFSIYFSCILKIQFDIYIYIQKNKIIMNVLFSSKYGIIHLRKVSIMKKRFINKKQKEK